MLTTNKILYMVYFPIAGNGKDYMNLALKDGRISLTVALGTGKLDTAIDPDNVRFDDNVWHHVLVQRHSSAVSSISLTYIFVLLLVFNYRN